MSGSFSGLKRLFNALSGDIRDKQDNPAKHRIMRSRAYITKLHTAPAKGDTRANTVMEWMVAKRNIDGSWKIHMESGVASGRRQNRFVMRNTRTIARETGFDVAAEMIRNYETRMAQVYAEHTPAKPTPDHVNAIAPAQKPARNNKTVSVKPQ